MILLKRLPFISNICANVEKGLFTETSVFSRIAIIHYLHTGGYLREKHKTSSRIEENNAVEKFRERNKQKDDFLDVVRKYNERNVHRRGQVEFIRVALRCMKEFGVHRDLEVYKTLLDILPKGKYIPTNAYQAMLFHYPKQQGIACEILEEMENNKVMPDVEMGDMLLNIFGQHSDPSKKYCRMMYWLPKFANKNPFPIPRPLPTDPKVLATLGIRKVCSADLLAETTLYNTKDLEDSVDKTWVVSSVSSTQKDLLEDFPKNNTLSVEGPFQVWLHEQRVNYFVLKGEPVHRNIEYKDADDVSNLAIPFWEVEETSVTIHEQEDGLYLAMCATGTSSKDSLLSWIKCLQQEIPALKSIPIVFKIRSGVEQLQIEDRETRDTSDMRCGNISEN